MQGFGDKLRKQREQRGLTLEAISSTTKISTRMLRALEEENFSQLPGGVFNKGFVRAYARQVGLDEEESVADYLAALSESQAKMQSLAPDLRSGKAPGRVPQSLTRVPHETATDAGPDAPSASLAVEQNPLATDRRLGQDRRSDEGRRIEARRGEDRSSPDRNREDFIPAEHGSESQDCDVERREPWQVENRPAAELLSAAHREDQTEARQSAAQGFTTGTFGESVANSRARIPWGTVSAALLIVCLGVAFWSIRRHRHPAPLAEVVPARTSQATPAMLKSSSATRPNSIGENETVRGLAKPERVSAAQKPAATKGSANASYISAANAVTKSLSPSDSAPGTSASSSPITPNARAIPAAAVVKTPAVFTLLIRAEETSWVSITADGKLVAEETLIAPAEKSIRANNQIVVKTGNAAGVSFLLNAKEIPASGNEGEVKTYTFGISGMTASPNSATVAAPTN